MATIGIDVSALSTPSSGGIGTSQYHTMRALAALETPHSFIMYAAKPPVIPFSDRPLDIDWPLRLGTGLSSASNIVWMQTGVNRLLEADGVDLVWGPRHLLPFRARGIKRVATVHDFWHLHAPSQQPLLNRVANRALIGRILKVADLVVTVSQATADDAITHYGFPPERLRVVPNGVDTATFKRMPDDELEPALARLGVQRPYLLSLDVFNTRKNFAAVLEGFAQLPALDRAGARIVGVGRKRSTATEENPVGRAAALGISDQVTVLDDVSFADLVALYSGALALVYPSVFEGFGMPVLEAMACGCPVITSKTSSLPEVAGDAALLVDPESATEIMSAMAHVLTSSMERGIMIEQGLARAREFSWERTARGMLAVFDTALEA